MLSIPDMALLGAAALLLFGPEQLPRVARKAGHVMREIQNTSQSFIREMERAADVQDEAEAKAKAPAYEPEPYGATPHEADIPGEPVGEKLAEPRPALGLTEPPEPEPEPVAPAPAPASASAEPAPQADHAAHL